MGYVFDFQDAGAYDAWFKGDKARYILDLEIQMLLELLAPVKGQRVLEIGCGTGIILEQLLDKDLTLTGVDPSTYMLDIAAKRLGQKVDLHKAYAEELPFEDNAFDCAILFTSLEFVDRPAKAVEEACRVAKDTLVICVLNRYAPLNLWVRLRSFFSQSVFSHARFFSIGELRQMLFNILGKVPVQWKTTLQFPFFSGRVSGFIERQAVVQKSFIGTLIGMKIKPVPKFRTRPMVLKIRKSKGYKQAPGMAADVTGLQRQDQ